MVHATLQKTLGLETITLFSMLYTWVYYTSPNIGEINPYFCQKKSLGYFNDGIFGPKFLQLRVFFWLSLTP